MAKRSDLSPLAKSIWDTSGARALSSLLPPEYAPMSLRASAIATGLRVNWTDEASASSSRWREIMACIIRVQSTPIDPIIQMAPPINNSPKPRAVPLSFLLRLREEGDARKIAFPILIIMLPINDIHRIPDNTPIIRMLSFMSPLRMWLNSCPTTACSSSREKSPRAPRVTAIAASLAENPAANALMPVSEFMTKTRGIETPEAKAISSTMLRRRRSW